MKLEENNIIVKRSYKTVYKCDDSIVKVFNEEHPKSDVFNEALITARIEETGLDIPKVKGVSLVEGEGALEEILRDKVGGSGNVVEHRGDHDLTFHGDRGRKFLGRGIDTFLIRLPGCICAECVLELGKA